MQSQVSFKQVSEKVPEKVWEALVQPGQEGLGGFGAEPGQVQYGESSGEGPGGFGAEPG